VTHPTPTADALRTASQRLVRTVDSLPDDAWRRPSLLPDWTVAHVVAHLALNAEGLAGVLVGVVEGEPTTTYRSQEDRDADIAKLGAASPDEIRDRLMASVTQLAAAMAALPEELAGTRIERTPGSGELFAAGAVGWMRLREVEIHHADLGPDLGPDGPAYSPADWPEEFVERLLADKAKRWDGTGFTATATDRDGSWTFGTPGPTVTAPAHALAWWVTGRAPYPGSAGPVSDDGVLPRIGGM
jgi:maleylpyruvate isomerase